MPSAVREGCCWYIFVFPVMILTCQSGVFENYGRNAVHNNYPKKPCVLFCLLRFKAKRCSTKQPQNKHVEFHKGDVAILLKYLLQDKQKCPWAVKHRCNKPMERALVINSTFIQCTNVIVYFARKIVNLHLKEFKLYFKLLCVLWNIVFDCVIVAFKRLFVCIYCKVFVRDSVAF